MSGRELLLSDPRERHRSDVYVRGTTWWDGPDIGGMHRPGEVRS